MVPMPMFLLFLTRFKGSNDSYCAWYLGSGVVDLQIDEGMLNATISDSPPFVMFTEDITIPSRQDLERVLSSVSAINDRLKAFDREVGLSKTYVAKLQGKSSQGRLSPVDGEPDGSRWPRESDQGRRRGGRFTGKGSFDRPYDDNMED
jgi:hypothetical protein